MEKDDKIQNQKQKTQKYGVFAVIVVMGVVGIVSMQNQPAAIQQQVNLATPPKKVWTPSVSLPELEQKVKLLDEEVRAIKKTGIIMETDPNSIQKTTQLQAATRSLLKAKYGDHAAYRVKVDLEFPPTIPDFAAKGKDGTIVIEMAPVELQPVSVYNFLEIARTWIRGSFHRNANHVLQVQAVSDIHKALPFQEYSKDYPHKKGTTGYAGRPSGPGWYVSIQDNTINHGPGSQQNHNPHEADANFGRVVEGFDDVVPRIHTIPQSGWLDQKNQIKIIKKTILIPDGTTGGGFKEWVDWTKDMDSPVAKQ